MKRIRPTAILLTHAHPDHAWGLADGAPCPVYATTATRRLLARYPVTDWRAIRRRREARIGGIAIEAFALEHSIRAPAVGYRISVGRRHFFYAPDVVAIRHRGAALADVDLYIGDGSSIIRPLVRRRGSALFGHAAIRTQLGWCRKEKVPRALFTHCGAEILAGDGRAVSAEVRALGRQREVVAGLAHDGMRLLLQP